MNSSRFYSRKKTLHSALFFVLLLTVGGGWLTLIYLSIPHLIALASLVEQTRTGLDFFIMFGVCFLAGVPFLLLWAWAAPRVALRLDRIAHGASWGGWAYIPAASVRLSAQQRLLRKRRWHLCWQIPLSWLAAAGWAVLVETQDGWNFDSGEVIPVIRAMVGMLGLALLELYVPFMLVARAFPGIRKMVREYVRKKYPTLQPAKWTRTDDEDAPSADLLPLEENDDDLSPALPDDPVREAHDYAALLNRAQVPAQTRAEQQRRKSLKLNLWWQTPALLLLAGFFMALGFEDTFITPLHVFQERDAVAISIIEPIMFWMGAGWFLPWLIALWVQALCDSTSRWEKIASFNVKLVAVVLAGCVLILPAQFLVMPWLSYEQCSRLKFRTIGSILPTPLPVRWIKSDSAKAVGCRNAMKLRGPLFISS